MKNDDKSKPNHTIFRHLELGTSIAAALLIFMLIGIYLDKKTGTTPLFLILGLLFAFMYGVYQLWKINNTLNKRNAHHPYYKKDANDQNSKGT